jgi:DNA modification methylase
VLDPFAGTATVGKVAERYGRDFLGIEASAAYIELADQRTDGVQIDMEALL